MYCVTPLARRMGHGLDELGLVNVLAGSSIERARRCALLAGCTLRPFCGGGAAAAFFARATPGPFLGPICGTYTSSLHTRLNFEAPPKQPELPSERSRINFAPPNPNN